MNDLQYMNNQILRAGQFLHQKDIVSHKQDMLNTLLGTNNAIPLDNQGYFMLVRNQYFNKLIETLQEGKKVKQNLEQQCHLLTISNVKANKQLEFLKAELIKFKQNESQFQRHFQSLKTRLNEAEMLILGLNEQLGLSRILSRQTSNIERSQNVTKYVPTKSTSSQTLYCPDQTYQSEDNSEESKKQNQNVEKEQNKLYQLLQSRLNEYSSMFQQKLNELEQCEFQLETWQKQKENLLHQNEELRSKVKTIDAEEEKIRIWNEHLTKLRQRIQENIKQPQIEQSSEQQGGASQEAALLRGKLAELRLQLREVDEQMQSQEQIGDEGAVVNLVKLTQRVKTIVRSLLVEASLPE